MATRLRSLRRFCVRTLAVVGAVSLVYHGFLDVAKVMTGCMTPFLAAGDKADWVVSETFFTAHRAPSRRFAIVTFIDDEGTSIAKRVVALPGETVRITRDRTLLINDVVTPVPETAGAGRGYLAVGNLADGAAFTVPPGHVYLLGDNTYDSQDSRFMGAVPIEQIRGRVLLRVRGHEIQLI